MVVLGPMEFQKSSFSTVEMSSIWGENFIETNYVSVYFVMRIPFVQTRLMGWTDKTWFGFHQIFRIETVGEILPIIDGGVPKNFEIFLSSSGLR